MDEKERTSETGWARENFRPYLFHRLSEEDEERLHSGLALTPELNDELDDAEAGLIREGLSGKLAGQDHEDFERFYVKGAESDRIKVKLERCLRLPEAQEPVSQAPIVPFSRPIPVSFYALAAAAVVLMCVGGVALYRESRHIRQLESELTNLKSELAARQKQGGTNPNPERANQEPDKRKKPEEQKAGETTSGGVELPAKSSGARLVVSSVPSRLIWRPVPDYRADYRIRIRAANGLERTSPLLTPRDFAVEYQPENAAALPFPWEVLVLGPSGQESEIARYTLVNP